MASILDRYGIKEVADVTFYKLDANGKPAYPVLYLDTLKVSTIEQTAEQSEARGGKGNPPLIIWDYGKEINVTLEDALFSAKSMAIMFGNGIVQDYSTETSYIMKTEVITPSGETIPVEGASTGGWTHKYTAPDGRTYDKINPKFYKANTAGEGKEITPEEWKKAVLDGEKVFCSYDLKVTGSVIEISANSFPGTYYVVGDTFARSEASGDDEFFQFIIPKAKVTSENTITLEAEGDPSVFNMNLRVMRPADGKMMKLVKYNLVGGAEASETETTAILDHSHGLVEPDVNHSFDFDGTVNNVTVTPSSPTITKGKTQSFDATVEATGGVDTTVEWTVDGATSTLTKINANGLLMVGPDESASELTVTATSKANSEKTGTATVTVSGL